MLLAHRDAQGSLVKQNAPSLVNAAAQEEEREMGVGPLR